jgi:hypothetical protein
METKYQNLLNALLSDTRSTDLRMKKHASHAFDVDPSKTHVSFGDLYGCRYVFDMDAGKKYDRDSEEDAEASVLITGRTVRKAHVYDGMALFVYDTRDFATDYDRDNWLRRAVLLGPREHESAKGPQKVHWVWMRIDGRPVDPKIIRRCCASWFPLNPPDEVEFHLWTNLKDSDDLASWLSNVSDEDDKRTFLERTTIHYCEETCQQFQGHSIDLSEDVRMPSSKDLFLMTDVLRLVLLANHGGYYVDFNDTLCMCPLKTIWSSTHDVMLAYEGTRDQREMNNFFVHASKDSVSFLELLSEIIDNHSKIREHVAMAIFPKALVTVASNVLDRILGGIKPPFNAYDLMSIATDLGDLRYAVSNALPDDHLTYRLVFGRDYFDIAREIMNVYAKAIVALEMHPRLGPVFERVYEAYACPWTLGGLCEFLNETFESDPSIAEDIVRVRGYLDEARRDIAKSSDLCASSVMFKRIFQFTNIGRHVCEMDRPVTHQAVCHCAFDVHQKYSEFKFDTFMIHLFDGTSSGTCKAYDGDKILLG